MQVRFLSRRLPIDKTIYLFHGNIGFRQGNPSTPAKYGFHFPGLRYALPNFIFSYAKKPQTLMALITTNIDDILLLVPMNTLVPCNPISKL